MTTVGAPESDGPASYYSSIEKTHGEPVSHWMMVLKQAGELKHVERVNLIDVKHKLGHGYANALVAHGSRWGKRLAIAGRTSMMIWGCVPTFTRRLG